MLLCVAGTALTARAQKVTLNFRNAKLEQVFGRITEPNDAAAAINTPTWYLAALPKNRFQYF